jgi:DNA-binding NtrC family response regulator
MVPGMPIEPLPRNLVRKIDRHETLPLVALAGIADLRVYLDEVETEAILKARDIGATVEDIAEALGITRQGVYYKLKALDDESESGTAPQESAPVIDLPDLEGLPAAGRPGQGDE